MRLFFGPLVCAAVGAAGCAPDWNAVLSRFHGDGGSDGDGGSLSQLSLVVPGPIVAQTCSPAPFIVQAKDPDGGLSQHISSVSVELSSNLDFCAGSTSPVTLTAGQAELYLLGKEVGTGTVHLSAAGAHGTNQAVSIVSRPSLGFGFDDSNVLTLKAGDCSPALRLRIFDSSGNPTVAPSGGLTVNIAAPGLEVFSDSATPCVSDTAVSSLVFPGGTSERFIRVRGTQATAFYDDLSLNPQGGTTYLKAVQINPGPPDHLEVNPQSRQLAVNRCESGNALRALDAFGNDTFTSVTVGATVNGPVAIVDGADCAQAWSGTTGFFSLKASGALQTPQNDISFQIVGSTKVTSMSIQTSNEGYAMSWTQDPTLIPDGGCVPAQLQLLSPSGPTASPAQVGVFMSSDDNGVDFYKDSACLWKDASPTWQTGQSLLVTYLVPLFSGTHHLTASSIRFGAADTTALSGSAVCSKPPCDGGTGSVTGDGGS